MKRRRGQFAICIRNDGCEDLEVRKVYRVLADASAAKHGYFRVVELAREAERALAAASR